MRGSLSWKTFLCPDYEFTAFPRGALVVDVGCGEGDQLAELRLRGCIGVGIEVDRTAAAVCRAKGLFVVLARAEELPLRREIADGVICKVAIPYTDESAAIAECARLLRPGGRMVASYHAAGYYLRLVLCEPSAKLRFYGLRALANTWLYRLTGKRIRGWIGDTLYQSRRRLDRYYSMTGLVLDDETAGRRFLAFAVFVYHRLRKLDSR